MSNDKHLAVRFDAPTPDQQAELDHEDLENRLPFESYTNEENLGIKTIGRLSGNIVISILRVFGLTQFAGPAIANAMQSLSNSDSLIIDLRETLAARQIRLYFCELLLPPKTRPMTSTIDEKTRRLKHGRFHNPNSRLRQQQEGLSTDE